MIGAFTFGPAQARSCGIVTFPQHMTMANGARMIAVWAPRWEIVTDASMPVDGFRSSERWTAVALNRQGVPVIIVPGCQVKCWAFAETPPLLVNECWVVE